MGNKLLIYQLLMTLLALLALTGCITTNLELGENGFQHRRNSYKLSYLNKDKGSFLPETWTLEKDPRRQPLHANNETLAIALDEQRGKSRQARVPQVDLKFAHQETNGFISIVSHPLSKSDENKKLNLLLRNIAENISGGYLSIQPSNLLGNKVLRSKNLASSIVDEKIYEMAGAEAIMATLEIANSDQLLLDPDHRLKRLKILLIRPEGRQWLENGFRINAQGKSEAIKIKYRSMIGMIYEMDPLYFDQYETVFNEFIQQFKL